MDEALPWPVPVGPQTTSFEQLQHLDHVVKADIGREHPLCGHELSALDPGFDGGSREFISHCVNGIVAPVAGKESRRKRLWPSIPDAPIRQDLNRDTQDLSDLRNRESVPRGVVVIEHRQPLLLPRGRTERNEDRFRQAPRHAGFHGDT